MSTKEPKARAVARVRLTIEIDAASAWGGDCLVSQVRKQSLADVEQALRRGLVIHGTTCSAGSKVPAHIVGEPRVTMTIVTDEEAGPQRGAEDPTVDAHLRDGHELRCRVGACLPIGRFSALEFAREMAHLHGLTFEDGIITVPGI